MESDNNIKNFFERKFLDAQPGGDDWNIPSDDIWNNALPHFPKEKKKKRPFFFFLIGAGVLAMLLAVGLYFSFRTDSFTRLTTNKDAQLSAPFNHATNTPLAINNTPEKSTQNITDKTSNTIVAQDKLDLIKTSTQNTFNNNSTNHGFQKKKKVENPLIILDASKKIKEKISETSETSNLKNKLGVSHLKNKTPLIDSETNIVSEKPIAALPVLFPEIIDKNKEIIDHQPTIIPIKRKRQLKKWEIGLSHSPFMFKWVNLLTTDSLPEGEELSFDIGYKNINLPISRRLGRRWSLSSGIALSRIKACVNFSSNNFVYDANQPDPDWTSILREQTNTIFINTSTLEELEINLSPDVNLVDGDSLELIGKIPVQLSFVQVPLILNYHFGKKRLEGLVHAGIYFNYMHERVRDVGFNLLMEDQIISESTNIDPYSDNYFAITPIIGFGLKYHLSDHFNLGVSTKIELFAPPLSRFEIGAYYSF